MPQTRPRYILYSNNHYLFFCPFLDIPGYIILTVMLVTHTAFSMYCGAPSHHPSLTDWDIWEQSCKRQRHFKIHILNPE